MPRGRHTATRFPLVVFIVLCLAVAGRQVAVGIQAMQSLAYSGRLGDAVVIALGTNGPFSRIQLARIVALAGGRRLVMLTNYCPYCSWVAANNELIRSGCRQVPG